MAALLGVLVAVGRCPGKRILRGGWGKPLQPFEKKSVSGVASAL